MHHFVFIAILCLTIFAAFTQRGEAKDQPAADPANKDCLEELVRLRAFAQNRIWKPKADDAEPLIPNAPFSLISQENKVLGLGAVQGNPGNYLNAPDFPIWQELPENSGMRKGLIGAGLIYGTVAGIEAAPYLTSKPEAEKPPKPAEEIAPEQEKIKLSTQKELILQAQEALRKWKKTGQLDLDFGKFFLESELVEGPKEDLEFAADYFRLHEEDIAHAQAIARARATPFSSGPPLTKIKALIQDLHPYLKRYCSDYALLRDFYALGCGNCEANTKMVLSAMLDGSMPLPPGTQLGAQLFEDHIQPVLVNTETKEVRLLLTGDITEAVEAPVYKPELLLYAYLLAKGADTAGVKESDLLLLDWDGAKNSADQGKTVLTLGAGEKFKTNTNLKILAKRGPRFNNGPPPPKFAQQNTEWTAARVPKFASQDLRPGTGASSDEKLAPPLPLIQQFRARLAMGAELKYPQVASLGFVLYGVGIQGLSSGEEIIFANTQLLNQWKNLQSDAEAEEFLMGIVQMALPKALRDPALQKLRALAKDPAQIGKLKDAEIYEIWQALDKLAPLFNVIAMPFVFGSDLPKLEESPAFKLLKNDFDSFAKQWNAEPEKWLKFLDSLPAKEVATFLRFMKYDFPRTSLKHPMDAIHNLVMYKKKVDYFRPSSFLGDLRDSYVLDFAGSKPGNLRATFYRPGKEGGDTNDSKQAGKEKLDFESSRPDAEIIISPVTMAGLLLLHETKVEDTVDAVNEMWSSVLTKNFAEYYANPEYDLAFHRIFSQLKFEKGFEIASVRTRYKDLSFAMVELIPESNPVSYEPSKNISPLKANPEFLIDNIYQGTKLGFGIPLEIAKHWEKIIDRQYQGKVKVKITPVDYPLPEAIPAAPPLNLVLCTPQFALRNNAKIGDQCKTKVGSKEFIFTIAGIKDNKVAIRDETSGLVWTDNLSGFYTHDDGVPSEINFNRLWGSKVNIAIKLRGDGAGKILMDSDGNPQIVKEVACESRDGIAARAGLSGKKFGLPRIREFKEAEGHGFRQALPNMTARIYWSATLDPDNTDLALEFYGAHGIFGRFAGRSLPFSVRCVGR